MRVFEKPDYIEETMVGNGDGTGQAETCLARRKRMIKGAQSIYRTVELIELLLKSRDGMVGPRIGSSGRCAFFDNA